MTRVCFALGVAVLVSASLVGTASAQSDDVPGTAPVQDANDGRAVRSSGSMNVFDATPAKDSQVVKELLQANPGSELIICVAGCKGAGQPMIMMKRPSKISHLEVAGLLPPVNGTIRSGSSQPDVAIGDEVICLAGCLDQTGTIVFGGRRHAWIKHDGRETLAAAMQELAARLLPATIASLLPTHHRNWVSSRARESLAGLSITRSGGDVVVAAIQ